MGWEGSEFLLAALSPEGDAALLKILGLDVRSSGWIAMSGALDAAIYRGLCFVHGVPRADGRYFVAAMPVAGSGGPCSGGDHNCQAPTTTCASPLQSSP
jgi:hypothetical protein